MCRMRRVSLLALILLVSVLFLSLQLYIIQRTLERNVSKEANVNRGSEIPVQYKAVSLFVDIVNEHDIPVFLVEPIVLKAIMRKRMVSQRKTKSCEFLCLNQNVTTFAAIDHLWKDKSTLLRALENHGFLWLKLEGPDPRSASVLQYTQPQLIPFHYLMQYQTHTIHLVIFYERSSLYLWQGFFKLSNKDNIFVPNNTFASPHLAAFKRVEVTQVKIDGMFIKVPKRPNQFLVQLKDSIFVECNYQQAAEFYKAHAEDVSQLEALDFRDKAVQVISDGQTLLDELGIPFWLSSGTCLGWFRECNIIPHSKDVDFGIWAVDYTPHIISAFEMRGWTLKHILGKVEDSYELSFIHVNGLKLDLFFFYEEGDHVWNGGTDVYTAAKYKYAFPTFSLCWTEFISMLLRVPCQSQAYIEANYGKYWKEKVVEWDWKSSPPNVQENGIWAEEDFQDVIQVF